ncbi:hypothetical protein TPA0909_01790 [Streptomyces albus]|nr:hypothetical protein TPA0909_01790 [Streptomyces albus]
MDERPGPGPSPCRAAASRPTGTQQPSRRQCGPRAGAGDGPGKHFGPRRRSGTLNPPGTAARSRKTRRCQGRERRASICPLVRRGQKCVTEDSGLDHGRLSTDRTGPAGSVPYRDRPASVPSAR